MRKLFVLLLALSFVLFAAGCGAKTTGKTEGATTAPAGEKIKWVMQSSWPEGSSNQIFATDLGKAITDATGGRLTVQVLPAGAVVAAGDVLDAVNSGTIDMTHTWPGYFAGKTPSLGLLVGQVAGLSPTDMMYFMFKDGNKLMQEAFDSTGNNCYAFTSLIVSQEIFMESRKPVTDIKDLKGLKVRATGDWGQIIGKLGASPVSLALGEVLPALERGTIDATEFSSPALNYTSGIPQLVKYVVLPGIHQNSTPDVTLINKKKFDALPDDLKAIVKMVAADSVGKAQAKWAALDVEYWNKYKEMEKAGKIKILKLTPEAQRAIKKAADEHFAAVAAKDPMSKKIFEAMNNYKATYSAYFDLQKLDI